ncbi:MAG: helix-turn-helix domain-containing protein [Pseudomonadota bacterium]
MRHADLVFSAITSARAARCKIAASWTRSLNRHGLDPTHRAAPKVLSDAELNARCDEAGRMLSIASAKLDHLFGLVGASGCTVVLTDDRGVVLDHRISDGDQHDFERAGIIRGADWSEEAEGTNGIGTCLVEGRSVIIHRGEHFLSKNVSLSCIDSPIYGANGELIGALDVSSARADQTGANNTLIAAMVAQTAKQIEADNFKAAFSDARIIFAEDQDADRNALIAVNCDDVIVGATRAARQIYGWGAKGALEPVAATDLFGRESRRGFERGEKAAVMRALTRSGGNVSAAAKALGIGRATLYRRMKRLGLAHRAELSRG